MRVTKTIRDYVGNQLNERRNAILAPYLSEANDAYTDFKKEVSAIANKAEERAAEQLKALAAEFNIEDPNGKIEEAVKNVTFYCSSFMNLCENQLPAKKIYMKKREEVNAHFDKECEELLVSLELGDMDKKSLLAAIAGAKLEG